MKKLWILFPVFLLMAGMVLTGCPTDTGGPEPVKVTFNSDGSVIDTQEVAKGGTVAKPVDPTKEGFNFAGWFTDTALTVLYDFDAPVNADLALYAKWEEQQAPGKTTFMVTFISNDGSEIEPIEVEEGGVAAQPADPVRTGFDFDGWFTDTDLTAAYDFDTPVTADFTLYAGWTKQEGVNFFTVDFDTDDGSPVTSVELAENDVLTRPSPDPTKQGYNFEGWFTDTALTIPYDFNTPVTTDFTLYAKWSLGFDPGLYDFTPVTITWDAGETNKKGWVEGEQFRDIEYSRTDAFLRITIQLDAGVGGSSNAGKFGEIGKSTGGLALRIPASTPAAAEVYIDVPVTDILGNVGIDAVSFYLSITNAAVVKVELVETKEGVRPTKPPLRTVKFILNDGTYDLDGVTYDNARPLPDLKVDSGKALGTRFYPSGPSMAGYYFAGWKSGGDIYDSTTVITADLTLTAQWSLIPPTFSVSFAGLTGATPPSIAAIRVNQNTAAGSQFPTTIVRKDGWWFDGWLDKDAEDDEEDGFYTKETVIAKDVTLTAQWTQSTIPAITKEGSLPGYKKVNVAMYTDGGEGADRETGKGSIEGASLAALKSAAPTSVLLLYLYMPSSVTDPRDEYGVGKVGDVGDDKEFKAPNPCPRDETFFATVSISDIPNRATVNHVFVNIYNDAILQRVELWEVDPDAAHQTWELTSFTENNKAQQGWNVLSIWDKVLTAKYLVLETEGIGNNQDGFGGIHVILNRPDFGGWKDTHINTDWTSYNRQGSDKIYLVIRLDKLTGHGDFVASPPAWAQIIIGYYGGTTAHEDIGLVKAYLTATELMPDGSVPGTGTELKNGTTTYGYIAKNLQFGQ